MPPIPNSSFASGPGYRIIKLGSRALARAESVLIGLGIKPRHLNVLYLVAANPSLSQREISVELGVDPNIMVTIIDDLEREGLAVRERSTADRRRHVVVVTAKGKQVLEDGVKALAQGEKDFFAALNADEREKFYQMCGKLLGM